MQKIIITLLVFGSLAIGGYVISLGLSNSSNNINSISNSDQSGLFSSTQELIYDWGDINIMGGNVSKSFTLTNTEQSPLLLTGAVTSCMCTTAEFVLNDGTSSGIFGMSGGPEWSHAVQPGESFEITVIFDPLAHGPNATGPITRTVNVISNPDPDSQGVQYTRIDVKGNVLSEDDYLKKYESPEETPEEDHHSDGVSLPDYEIGGTELINKLKGEKTYALIDVRENAELAESGVIEGAIHIPLGDLSLNSMNNSNISKDDEVIVYCRSGNRSRQAYELLNTLGYTNVKSLNGGIVHWMEDNRSLVPWNNESIGDAENESENASGAKISFDRTSEDFGLIGPTEVKSTTFSISNTGAETLEIGNITTSCMCTSAEIQQKSLEPFESTILTVTFDPNVHEEPVEKFKRTVFLETNDPENPEAEVEIWVDINEEI